MTTRTIEMALVDYIDTCAAQLRVAQVNGGSTLAAEFAKAAGEGIAQIAAAVERRHVELDAWRKIAAPPPLAEPFAARTLDELADRLASEKRHSRSVWAAKEEAEKIASDALEIISAHIQGDCDQGFGADYSALLARWVARCGRG